MAAGYRALSDRELLECYLAQRDQVAFEALLSRHGPRVFAVCRQILGGDDVEDAFQATFLVLLDKARRIPWHDSLGSWLAAVAHRTAVRARSRRLRRSCLELPSAVPTTTSCEGELLWREACAILHEELDRLPDRFRLPLLLCYLEGHSRDEAAQRLGWSLGAVKAGLERGRARLRQCLQRRGITLSAGLLSALSGGRTAAAPPVGLLQATLQAAIGAPSSRVAALASVALTLKLRGKARLVLALLLAGLCAGLGAAICNHLPGEEAPIVALASRLDPPAPDDSASPRTVRGRVLAPDGKPVARARVSRLDWRLPARKWDETKVATTGPDGRFTVEVGGRCILAASAAGFAPDWTSDQPADEVTLTLAHDTPVRGQLVGPGGKPVPGATVRVLTVMAPAGKDLQPAYNALQANPDYLWDALPRQIDGGKAGLPAQTTMDRDGRFELAGLGRSRVVELRFEAPGIEATTVCVVTVGDFGAKSFAQAAVYGPTFTHSANPDQLVRGRVTDAATGKPLPGVNILGTARPPETSCTLDWRHTVETTTDVAGRFVLSGLPRGRQKVLLVQSPQGPYQHRVVAVNDDGMAPIEIELGHCVVVEGRLIDAVTGKPVKGVVEYLPLDDNEYLKAHLAKGEYPGQFGLGLSPLLLGAWAVAEDGTFRLRVLPGPGVILARAGITGSPVARYRAACAAPGDRKYLRRTEKSGFVARLVERLFSYSRRSNHQDRPAQEVFRTVPMYPLRWVHGYAIINPDETEGRVACTIALDPGWTVTGKVVGPDGRPVAGVKAAGIRGPDERWATTFRTDAFTAYAVDAHRPRPLYFLHEGRKLAAMHSLRPDEKEVPVVRLQPWSVVTGRVLGPDGTPAVGARVRFGMADPDMDDAIWRRLYQGRPPVETDRGGRFRIEGLVPGCRLTFFASKAGCRQGWTFPPVTPAADVTDIGEVRLGTANGGERGSPNRG
jgi:RNA polymerase sigma factor (sigma-70 family)